MIILHHPMQFAVDDMIRIFPGGLMPKAWH